MKVLMEFADVISGLLKKGMPAASDHGIDIVWIAFGSPLGPTPGGGSCVWTSSITGFLIQCISRCTMWNSTIVNGNTEGYGRERNISLDH